MADSIQVKMDPVNFKSAPGGTPMTARLTIHNAGTIVDQYKLQLQDLPESWYTLPPTSAALFPNDSDSISLQLHPPAGSQTRAGSYPFTVSIISQADPAQYTRMPAILVITAVDQFELELTPRRQVGRKGKFQVTIRNGGNSDVEATLEVSDPEELSRYDLSIEEAHLEPGQKETAQLIVKPRRNGWFGLEKEFRFEVRAKPGKNAAKTIQGTVSHKPRFKSFRAVRKFVTFLAIIIVLIFAYFALGQWPGIQEKASEFQGPAASWACQKRIEFFCESATPTGTVTPTITATPDKAGQGGNGNNGNNGNNGTGTNGTGTNGTAVPTGVIGLATPGDSNPTATAAPTFTPFPTSTATLSPTQVPTQTAIPTSTPATGSGFGTDTPVPGQ